LSNIRPKYIKKTAQELVENNPGLFTTKFETNKYILDDKWDIESKQVRNRIAGYIITVIKNENNNYEPVRLLNKEKSKRKKGNKK